jgi:hypothetical protein
MPLAMPRTRSSSSDAVLCSCSYGSSRSEAVLSSCGYGSSRSELCGHWTRVRLPAAACAGWADCTLDAPLISCLLVFRVNAHSHHSIPLWTTWPTCCASAAMACSHAAMLRWPASSSSLEEDLWAAGRTDPAGAGRLPPQVAGVGDREGLACGDTRGGGGGGGGGWVGGVRRAAQPRRRLHRRQLDRTPRCRGQRVPNSPNRLLRDARASPEPSFSPGGAVEAGQSRGGSPRPLWNWW